MPPNSFVNSIRLLAVSVLLAPTIGLCPAAAAQTAPDTAAQDPPKEDGAPRRRRRPPTATAALPPVPQLTIRRVVSIPSELAPTDAIWESGEPLEVTVIPQAVTAPMLAEASIPTVEIRGVTDGKDFALLLTWADAEVSNTTETGHFSDAVGVQFPLVPGAPYLMGGPGMPVHSLYWRAHWQRDIDDGFVDINTLYPNSYFDCYWFAQGESPRVPDSFRDPRSHHWFIGLSAGNPMSIFDRKSPIEEATAEGFGSITHVPDGIADGRGAWKDGHWRVVIRRRLIDDTLSKLLAAGSTSEFAIAVWNGEKANVGGRKHHSIWVKFEVEK